jgi:DNA (cytosine-5)-methyltransferase 1
MRFVADLKPKVVVMENVAEIYNAFDGKVRNEIIDTFNNLGYKISVKILTAADYGVPQKRRRCIFLAVRSNVVPIFPEPTHTPEGNVDMLIPLPAYVSAWEAIRDLPKPTKSPGEKIKYDQEEKSEFGTWVRNPMNLISNHFVHTMSPIQIQRYKSLKPGEDIRHLPDDLRPRSGYSGAYGRLDFKNVAPTITRWVFHPGSGRYGHPMEPRVVTMREAARLQSFTDDFEFVGTKNEIAGQIGNSVPPLLMFALAPTIRKLLKSVGS